MPSDTDSSYTKFTYGKLESDAKKIDGDGQVQLTVRLKNSGPRDSDEIVQLYVQHLGSAVERPQLELKGFRRVHVKAGATATATMTVKARDLAYWNSGKHVWQVEREKVRFLAGGSSDNLPLSAEVQIDSPMEFKP